MVLKLVKQAIIFCLILLFTGCVSSPQNTLAASSDPPKDPPPVDKSVDNPVDSPVGDKVKNTSRNNSDLEVLKKRGALQLRPPYRFDPRLSSTKQGEKREYKKQSLTLVQRTLLEGALKVVGKNSPVLIKGKRFAADCSGTIRAIYFYADIDLAMDYYRYDGSGTYRIFKALNSRGLLTMDKNARVGDIIFWDNSYDANKDGKFNDELTHMGMVTAVYNDGSVDYIHYHYKEGNIIERMNLFAADIHIKNIDGKDQLFNSPMRAKSDMKNSDTKWLSGQLFRVYGQAYHLASKSL